MISTSTVSSTLEPKSKSRPRDAPDGDVVGILASPLIGRANRASEHSVATSPGSQIQSGQPH